MQPRARKGTPICDPLSRDLALRSPEETGAAPDHLIPRFILDQDKGRNTTHASNYDRATHREHPIRYDQTTTGLDHVIGGLLVDLQRRGSDQNTVILFGSDHGLIMGEYGRSGKGLLLDLAAKIPSFIHDPPAPRNQRGRTLDHRVSGIDYARTMLDYAGVPAPAEMERRSLRPLVAGNTAGWRDELHLESLFALRDNPFQEASRTTRWKYIRLYDGVNNFLESHVDFRGRAPEFERLFDLAADPGERTNLAAEMKRLDDPAELTVPSPRPAAWSPPPARGKK